MIASVQEQTTLIRAPAKFGEARTNYDQKLEVVSTVIEKFHERSLWSKLGKQKSISECLFDATAQAKIWISRVAMHLSEETLARLNSQLDRLHDEEEWMDGDEPINLPSFQTFIRSLLYHDVDQKPSLALLPDGRLMGLWRDEDSQLTVDFMPGDQVRWSIKSQVDEVTERASGITSLTRLQAVLAPYNGGRWFNGS